MEEHIVKPVTNPTSAPAVDPVVETTPKVEQSIEIKPAPQPSAVNVDTLIPSDDYRTSPLWYEVVQYLGVPQQEWASAKNEVSVIVDYVIREIKSNDPDKILVKLREMEDVIQKPEWGTSRTKNLYRYIRLAAKDQAIKQAMKAFEKRGFNG